MKHKPFSTIQKIILMVVAIAFICSEMRVCAQPGSLGAWNATTSLPYPVDSPAAVALNGYIYVFGGYANPQGVTPFLDNSVHTAAVNLDGTLQSWQTRTSFSTGRRLHAVALDSANSRVYVIGGCITTSSLAGVNDVQFAHVSAGGVSSWTSTTPLPAGISGHTALCYDGYLYVFRGNDQFGGAAQGYYYAPISPSDGTIGTWRQGTLSFPVRRYFGTFAYNDHFYLIGGNNGSSTAFNNVYDTRVPQRSSLPYLQMNETEVWNDTTPFQNARWLQGTANANGFAYITGGETTAGSPPDRSDVQYAPLLLDGSVGLWLTTASLPTTLANHGCVISSSPVSHASYIYVLGGDKGVGFGFQEVSSVLYAPILSSFDTTPPVTQISPTPGQQLSSTVNVTLTASDVGGSGVASIRYTTDGSDPATSGSTTIVNAATATFSIPVPVTVRFFAKDVAGNAEQTQTASFSVSAGSIPIAYAFDWPVGSPAHPIPVGGPKVNYAPNDAWYIAQDFLDPNGDTPVDNYRHLAQDLSRTGGADIDVGETVKSIGDGILIGVGYVYNSGQHFGHVVLIKHHLPNGSYVVSLYAHLGTAGLIPSTRLGTRVAMGEPIGLIGANSPTENGGFLPHVHLEIRTPKAVGDSVNLNTPIGNPASPDYADSGVGDGYWGPPGQIFQTPDVKGEWLRPSDWILGHLATQTTITMLNSGGLNDVATTSPTISANGSLIGFRNSPFFHLIDPATGLLQQENVDGNQTTGNGSLFTAVFSADSSVKAFASDDANLVSNDTNGVPDIFVWTQTNSSTERISVSSTGDQANGASYDVGMSSDGSLVVFTSVANNLVANDTNQATDIFIRNRQTNQTSIISVDSNGIQGNGPSYSPSISADGRYVAFVSEASNLIAEDSNGVADIFVRDLQENTTTLVSKTWNGGLANGASRQPSISGDGRYIAYESDASNLVPDDTNGFSDVFLYDSVLGTVQRLSIGPNGQQGNGNSHEPRISAYGLRIAFTSEASNFTANDTNGLPDVFFVSFSAPPFLSASLAGNNIVLSWPTNNPPFNLESTTNLNPGVWLPVSPIPVISGDQNVVTNAISGQSRFYRLKQ